MFKIDGEKNNRDLLKHSSTSSDSAAAPHKHSDRDGATSADQKVSLTGGLSLGDTDNLALTPDELIEVFNKQIDSEQWNSARSLVRLYPDVVTRIMMGHPSGRSSAGNLTTIARLFDEQWSGDGQNLWEDFVDARSRDDQEKEFLTRRIEFLKLLENNHARDALDLKLTRRLGEKSSVLARAEAHRLEGVAELMLEDGRQSSQHFEEAVNLLVHSHPHQASQIGLLLGEAHRHAGAQVEWKSSWESAIELHSHLLADHGLSDPSFWKKAAFLRPVSTEWPKTVIARLESTLARDSLDFAGEHSNDEAVVWALIGTQSLNRHEAQNAILAFKKSEALVSGAALKKEIQMQQALAMIDGGQPGPASAILLRLSSESTLLGDRAKAILATLKLQNGSLAQGMNLLQTSIKTASQWPVSERLRAQADYGLAFLMLGREAQGIALLNHVHDEFVEQHSYDHAAQCLANMATYYEKTDQPKKRKQILARME